MATGGGQLQAVSRADGLRHMRPARECQGSDSDGVGEAERIRRGKAHNLLRNIANIASTQHTLTKYKFFARALVSARR